MIDKNLVLINYLKENANVFGINNFKVKSEYSLDEKDINVVVVQLQQGEKEVLFCGNINDYFMIQIFGQSIREEKQIAVNLNNLIGENVLTNYDGDTYQIMFMQFSNAQTIVYEDIQRVGYTLTLKTIISKIMEGET
jgi:hypothetical protein